MQAKKLTPGKGRGRGVLALSSFDPLPRPSKALVDSHLEKTNNVNTPNGLTANTKCEKPVNVVKPLQPAPEKGSINTNFEQESLVKNSSK